MAKKQIRRSDLADLDRAIARRFPSLSRSDIRKFRSQIIRYVTQGLADGCNIALIRQITDEEIRLKVLNLREEHEK